MSSLFKKPKPKLPPPPPQVDFESAEAAGDAERRRQRAAAGRQATVFTGGSGLSQSANIGTSALLGR